MSGSKRRRRKIRKNVPPQKERVGLPSRRCNECQSNQAEGSGKISRDSGGRLGAYLFSNMFASFDLVLRSHIVPVDGVDYII